MVEPRQNLVVVEGSNDDVKIGDENETISWPKLEEKFTLASSRSIRRSDDECHTRRVVCELEKLARHVIPIEMSSELRG